MPETEPWEYSLYIPNDHRAVTVSRRTLRLILTVHGLIGLVDVAELLAAELDVTGVDAEGGRRLALVRACSDVWGWQPLSRFGNRGKYVWCELGQPGVTNRAS
ncbi:ATP-binding protein [Streptomyces sp. NPDC023723]|uniref:ATP-binding protein n=1 Tax=Streptomyces sp. NPDC023723 TaxID=3154323 RepID=UPI0033EADB59